MARFIPNFITLLNLLFGSIAVVFAVQGNLSLAAGFVILGIFLDFFDGLAARVLKVQSDIGKQLDSLADVVTSGLAPGIVMMQLINMACLEFIPKNLWDETEINLTSEAFLPLLGLIVTLGSAYRLAKFNIDERQTNSFIGLPTPANALWIISLPLILIYQPSELAFDILLNPFILIVLTLISVFLLNAPIPLFSLKFKTRSFKANSERYVFLIVSIALLVTLWFVAIPLIILLYLIISLIANKRKNV
ncbi:CDP-alcohol phosphatidyltransferase family protein [uncultured Planktosalinus sp.]|uniref:CDP-alcohol phosphatidyltransferase family protein n=1 Tax=uncultured Planktosalinus sp. TaxID=1810935 RepID=UPI0030DD207A